VDRRLALATLFKGATTFSRSAFSNPAVQRPSGKRQSYRVLAIDPAEGRFTRSRPGRTHCSTSDSGMTDSDTTLQGGVPPKCPVGALSG
jgi:hypothetical protein